MCFSARKLLSIRLFDDDSGKRWQKSVKDMNLEMLCVSQFTLYNRLKGNKPDFHLAMSGPDAQTMYNSLLQQLQKQYVSDRIKGNQPNLNKVTFLECILIANKNAKVISKFIFRNTKFRWTIRCNDAGAYTKRWPSDHRNRITDGYQKSTGMKTFYSATIKS